MPSDLEPTEEELEEKIFDSVTRALMSRITIQQQGKSQLVQVQVDMADKVLAARAANALATGYIESQMEARLEMSASATAWMNSRMGELRSKLKTAEDTLQAFVKRKLSGYRGVPPSARLKAQPRPYVDARRARAEAKVCTAKYNPCAAPAGNVSPVSLQFWAIH